MMRRYVLPLGFCAAAGWLFLAAGQDTVLYEKESAYSHIVVKEDDEGLRYLLFEEDGALQSVVKVGDPDHLALPYARVMPVGLAYVENPGRVLIVGLGGGTIPSFLRKHYPDLTIDIVDIDPDVVDVAKRFFGFVEDARMRAHVADGRKFIEETKRPYDIIFLDAFGCDNVPFHLTTREFLAAVRRALAPGGIVVGNIWSSWSNPLHDRMVRTYQEVFEELTLYKVSGAGNEILVGLPRTGKIEKAAVAARAQAISRERRFPHDLGEAVRYGYRYLTDQRGPAAVLTDAERPPKKDPAR